MKKKLLKLHNYIKDFSFKDELKKYDKKNKNINFKNIVNCRKNLKLTEGFDEARNKKLGLRALQQFSSEDFVELINYKIQNVGNCNFSINIRKKIKSKIYKLKTDSQILYDYFLFNFFKKKIKFKKTNYILAIGEGFGSFCVLIAKYFLLKKKLFKFVIYELPLQNLIIYYYLKKIFPSKKILTVDRIKNDVLSYKDFRNHDFIIITPNISLDKRIKFDFVFTKMSMMNMEYSSIKNYMNIINNHLKDKKYFLLVNKYFKKNFRIYKILKYLNNYQIILSSNIKIRYDQHLHLFRKNNSDKLSNIAEFLKISYITNILIIKNYMRKLLQ